MIYYGYRHMVMCMWLQTGNSYKQFVVIGMLTSHSFYWPLVLTAAAADHNVWYTGVQPREHRQKIIFLCFSVAYSNKMKPYNAQYFVHLPVYTAFYHKIGIIAIIIIIDNLCLQDRNQTCTVTIITQVNIQCPLTNPRSISV